MTEGPFLPVGTYTVQVMVIGVERPDGGVLFQDWRTPLKPEHIGLCMLRGVDQWLPRNLPRIPEGAWLVILLDCRLADGRHHCLPAQEQFGEAVEEDAIRERLGQRVVRLSLLTALELAKSIGIAAPPASSAVAPHVLH